VARGKKLDVPVVLGSATPSLESLQRCNEGAYRHLSLPQRAGGAVPPRLTLVDLARHQADDGLSAPVVTAIADCVAARGQVLVFLNRRGFSPSLRCNACGEIQQCPACSVALTRHRGAGMGGGHDEREQTLNQLLVEMDGFESNEGVILIAATNRPDVLDPALLRPGRFDRRVVVPRPDLRGRLAVLKVHTRRVPVDDNVDLEVIARGTPGFVGADLQNLVNESALLAARRNAQSVAAVDFEAAKDKVILGAERRSMIMTDEDKRTTAYHEAGHALLAMLQPDSDSVHKVTIIPRGMALGVTQTMPDRDRYNLTKEQILAQITHAMGGRAAEKLVLDNFSTGASNDLKQATQLARQMICNYGMNERIGPVSLADDDHDVFLGRDFAQRREYSEKKAQEIDEEVACILKERYDDALEMLRRERATLDRIAEALLERETLDTSELLLLMDGKPLPPLPDPIVPESSPPKRAGKKPEGRFPGDKLPEPEPVPG